MDSIEEPITYEIRTVHDMLGVPPDRWEAMCKDLVYWLGLMSNQPAVSEHFEDALELPRGTIQPVPDGAFRWVDDGTPPGLHSLTLVDGETGEEVVTIPVRRPRLKGPASYHLKVDVKGALRNWRASDWKGCVTGDDGRVLTTTQVKEEFLEVLARGEKYISCAPPGACPDFDPIEHGCPGHPVEERA